MNDCASFPALVTADLFHRERSRCIDAFALLEEAIIARLQVIGVKFGSECLRQKIELLKGAEASARYSKACRTRVQALIPQILEQIEVRNDIVHARIRLAQIDGEEYVAFINSRHSSQESQLARLFTLDALKKLTVAAKQAAHDLRRADGVSPASSPPPPSRAAASGP